MGDCVPVEIYRLIFKHEYIDEDGIAHEVDVPLVLDHMSANITGRPFPQSITISKMMDAMKEQLIKRAQNNGV